MILLILAFITNHFLFSRILYLFLASSVIIFPGKIPDCMLNLKYSLITAFSSIDHGFLLQCFLSSVHFFSAFFFLQSHTSQMILKVSRVTSVMTIDLFCLSLFYVPFLQTLKTTDFEVSDVISGNRKVSFCQHNTVHRTVNVQGFTNPRKHKHLILL